MGSTIAAESKMMFYPTDVVETYRILGVIGGVDFAGYYSKPSPEIENFVGNENKRNLQELALDNDTTTAKVYYDFVIRNKRFDLLKHFTLQFAGSQTFVVADFFAGEGDWLSTFKAISTRYCNPILLGNEIEEERYKKMKAKCDYAFNAAFEELEIPKQCVSLMLFNPPYGSSNGERNTKRYLRMILEGDYISRTGSYSQYNTAGSIVMVIRKSDVIDCLEMIVKNFKVLGIYRVNNDEYAKYEQFVIYANIRKSPLSESIADINTITVESEKILYNVEKEMEFSLSDYDKIFSYSSAKSLPQIDIETAIANFQVLKNKEKYISNPGDKAWKWFSEQIKTIDDYSLSQVVMPRQPKPSEIANIIAAGYINADVNDGNAPHIAIGGVKTLVKREQIEYNDETGKKITEERVTRSNSPYLNILYSKDGKIIIKELSQ